VVSGISLKTSRVPTAMAVAAIITGGASNQSMYSTNAASLENKPCADGDGSRSNHHGQGRGVPLINQCILRMIKMLKTSRVCRLKNGPRIQAHSKFHPITIYTRLSENDLLETQNTTYLIMLIKIQPKNTPKHPKNSFSTHRNCSTSAKTRFHAGA
jgi:hypothetical protein